MCNMTLPADEEGSWLLIPSSIFLIPGSKLILFRKTESTKNSDIKKFTALRE